jgi:hypothetical protein
MSDNMNILDIRSIIEAQDVTEKVLPIPEWGGAVRVKSISHRTMRDIKKALEQEHTIDGETDVPEDELEKWILIKGMVEPQISEEEYELLLDKSYGAIQKVLMGIMGSSKLGEKAVKEAERQFPAEPERVHSVQPGGTVGDDSRDAAERIVRPVESL